MARPKNLSTVYNLRQNASGYWELRWWDGQNTRKASTGHKDRPTAEKAVQGIIAKAATPKPATDVAGVCAAYEKGRSPRVHNPEAISYSLSPIIEQLGTLSPYDLTPAVIEDYVAKRRTTTSKLGRPYADGSILRELNALRSALLWSYKNRVLPRQPPPLAMPPFNTEPRDRYLTKDEVQRICLFLPPHAALFVRIALATAARRTAILELTWDRVTMPDLGSGLRDMRQHFAERIGVPVDTLPPDLVITGHGTDWEGQDRLAAPIIFDMGQGRGNKKRARTPVGNNMPLYLALRHAREIAQTDHVIEWKGKPVTTLKKTLETAFRKASVEAPGHHVFEHTAVSWMVQSAVDWNVVSALSGTSVETLKKVYGRLSPDNFLAVGAAVTF